MPIGREGPIPVLPSPFCAQLEMNRDVHHGQPPSRHVPYFLTCSFRHSSRIASVGG